MNQSFVLMKKQTKQTYMQCYTGFQIRLLIVTLLNKSLFKKQQQQKKTVNTHTYKCIYIYNT